jgi:outer membrane lipoprotein-sorting protein
MKKYLRTAALLLGFVLALAALPAQPRAQEESRPPSVEKAEHYLALLRTATARFVQTAPDGHQLSGTFYLSRPGRLRFEYDPPVKDFIVADGTFIYFYDSQLGEQSNAPIGQTLADFLLRPNLRLGGDLKVTNVVRSDKLTQISLVQAADPGAGKLTLGFTDEPFALKKWRVVDSTGAVTEVELFDLKTGIPLSKQLFYYHAPAGATHYN